MLWWPALLHLYDGCLREPTVIWCLPINDISLGSLMPHYPSNILVVCSPYLLGVRLAWCTIPAYGCWTYSWGFLQNIVIIIYIHNNYILVALTGNHRGCYRLICVYLVGFTTVAITSSILPIFWYWIKSVVLCLSPFFCWLLWIIYASWSVWIGPWLWPQIYAYVDFFCRKSIPIIKVALIDGSCPCILYRTEWCCM